MSDSDSAVPATVRIKRRSLLLGGAYAVVSAAPSAVAAEPNAKLPPSIAALGSLRSQVTPISNDERRQRIVKAQKLMSANAIDAILLTGGASLFYFTGMRWGNSERLFACVIPIRGRAFFVCPSFEEDRVRERLDRGPLEDAAVLTWHEDENPY
jgi:Xaa-Pro dipeptidase